MPVTLIYCNTSMFNYLLILHPLTSRCSRFMFKLGAHYLTEASVRSECKRLGSVPDTQRSFTGQQLSGFCINRGHVTVV